METPERVHHWVHHGAPQLPGPLSKGGFDGGCRRGQL